MDGWVRMGGNSVEGEGSTILDIRGEVAEDGDGLALKMKRRINSVKLLKPTVDDNHCIFRLPESFQNIQYKSYEAPQMVSIGPYHWGNNDQDQIKWQCLKCLLKRNGGDLNRFIESIRPLEIKARECYSETIHLDTDDFLEIMVLDGCFILEWLRFAYLDGKGEKVEKDHALARMGRVILLKIYRDLLLLENQIPLFVLKELFKASEMSLELEGKDSFLFSMVVEVFSEILGNPLSQDNYSRFKERFHLLDMVRSQDNYSRFEERFHLLDMVRSIFIPPGSELLTYDREIVRTKYQHKPFDTIPCMSKLRRAGIKVRPRKKNVLKVEFQQKHGVIEMPTIILNDLMCSFLVNCVAFEQCHEISSDHFSIYVLSLYCLVNTAGDIEYLCDHKVIENYIETDNEAAQFINNLGKGLTFDSDYVDFYIFCREVNEYYRKRANWLLASFSFIFLFFCESLPSLKREYFRKPWLWTSAFGALVLFVLTFLQTFFGIYAYVHPKC